MSKWTIFKAHWDLKKRKKTDGPLETARDLLPNQSNYEFPGHTLGLAQSSSTVTLGHFVDSTHPVCLFNLDYTEELWLIDSSCQGHFTDEQFCIRFSNTE